MSRLIDADALLKKTINNPLHVPYITKKDVIDMPSALNNQVNLCDSCTYTYPECPSEKDDVIFGNGIGNDNICACNKYQPTVQLVATDTNVGDTISRQAAIDALDTAIEHYDGIAEECRKKADIERNDYMDMRDDAYEARQLAQWLNELKYLREKIEQLTVKPEPKWIPCSERMPDDNTDVLLQFKSNMGVGFYEDGDWAINTGDGIYSMIGDNEEKPIAWMPLPEAYKEGGEKI